MKVNENESSAKDHPVSYHFNDYTNKLHRRLVRKGCIVLFQMNECAECL